MNRWWALLGAAIVFTIFTVSTVWPADTLPVSVLAHGRGFPEAVAVEATPDSMKPTAEILEVQLVDGRGELSLPMDQAEGWTLRMTTPGFWSPELVVASPFPDSVELHIWPAVAVSAELKAPEDADPPTEIHLTLNQVPEPAVVAPEQPETARIRCPAISGRLDDCTVPAGRWHLRIKAADYVPRYRWNLHIGDIKTVDLGEISLERGASLFGKVTTSDGSPLSKRARVELTPLVDQNVPDRQLTEEIQILTETAVVNEWGFFLFDAVLPRTYGLVATEQGFMPTTLPRVTIGAGQQVELAEPLVLERALQLTVFVSPEEDFKGEPWAVKIFCMSPMEERKTVAEGSAETGQWVSPPLAAGPYAIFISDGQGNRLAWEEIVLTEAEQNAWIELEYVHVSGTVVHGDEPLAAQLAFSAERSETSTESNEDGEFNLVLPQPGRWLVRVNNEDAGIDSRGIAIDIEPEDTEEILIEVPDTTVRGEVVFKDGTPAPDARVTLVNISSESNWPLYEGGTESDGRFELRGLQPSIYRVEASRGRLKSGIETVHVSESETAPSIQLVLRENWMLKGKVVSESEPVPAATIWALPFTAHGTYATNSIAPTRSTIDGSFVVEVPETAEVIRITTMALGFTLNASTATRGEHEAMETFPIRLSTGGGTLQLSRAVPNVVVVMNGVPIPSGFLTQWASMYGERPHSDGSWTVPAMPAGAYGYCDLTPDEAMLVIAGIALPTSDRCTEGFLSEGGTLTISAPEKKRHRSVVISASPISTVDLWR